VSQGKIQGDAGAHGDAADDQEANVNRVQDREQVVGER
jgi:hypothetical protein